jgi:aromatic-L-amino-acid/L-tryptophan decarboxylase
MSRIERPKTEPSSHAAAEGRGTGWPLEPDRREMERILDTVRERVVQAIESLDAIPAFDFDGAESAAAEVRQDHPGKARPLEDVLDLLFDRLAPKSFNNPGPRFMAYIPGGGLFHSAVADLIAGTLNRYVTVWAAAPGLAQLESNVVRWFQGMVGYPESAGGFLSSGGSIANFSAVVTARSERLGEEIARGTVYVSDQTHHSVIKAARLAGIREEHVRAIGVDSGLRIRVDELEARIEEDRAHGLVPFLLVGNGGTTNTGAVDPLQELAAVATRHGLWLHVDAAYGGFFALTARGCERLRGLELADSITLDPHKGLFLPYGTGCLLAKDAGALRRAHSLDADYMPELQTDDDRVDFCSISPELSRSFRGLRIWLPVQLLGIEPFRQALDEKLDLADWAAAELSRIEALEIVAPPQLSTLAFRLRGDDPDGARQDARNRRLLELIHRERKVLLTPTRIGGRFVIRICILNFRTHREHVEDCVQAIRRAVADL